MDTWTEKDLDKISWHDSHVYGFAIREGEEGTGQLIIDLDYIVEWLAPTPETFRFRVAPATLIFNRMSDLQLSLNYVNRGIQPFAIVNVERTLKTYPNSYKTYLWRIVTDLQGSTITFQAESFTQEFRSDPIETEGQYLPDAQRAPMK